MEKKINLEEIIDTLQNGVLIKSSQSLTIDFKIAMITFGEQLLKLAAKNAKSKMVSGDVIDYLEIDKQSILNTINQVE